VILVDCLLIDILCTLLSVPSALISLQSPKLTISRYTAQSSSSAPNPSSANLNQPISPLPSYQELTIPASSALPSHRRIRRQLANLLHSPLRSRTFTIRQQCLAFLAFPHAEHRCLHTYQLHSQSGGIRRTEWSCFSFSAQPCGSSSRATSSFLCISAYQHASAQTPTFIISTQRTNRSFSACFSALSFTRVS
jgi:hypothetical protein